VGRQCDMQRHRMEAMKKEEAQNKGEKGVTYMCSAGKWLMRCVKVIGRREA